MDLNLKEETGFETPGKRKTASKERERSTKKRTVEKTLLNKWELLPQSESKWMRGLLEIPGESILTLLPCIKDETIMPTEVSNILKNGRGKIVFYANVVHVTLCPRFLVNGNALHKHHNDSAVAICITETSTGLSESAQVHRLFVRCFSQKCMHLCRKSAHMQIPSKWEEYKPHHYIRFARLSRARDPVSPKAT